MATRKSFKIKELITIEELIWLFVGLAFGFFIGKGAGFFLIVLPIAAFVVWAFKYFGRKQLF